MFVLPSLSAGGAERATAAIAGKLDATSFRRSVVVERDLGASYPLASDVRVEVIGAPRARSTVLPLIRILRRDRPDVIYAALPHLNTIAAIARRLLRPSPRLVVSVHNNQRAELADVPRGRLLRWAAPFVYASADAIVAVSQGVAEEISRFPGTRGRVHVINNPIALDEIRRLTAEPPPHRWLDGTHDVIVAIGRLTHQKGFDVLLRAFAQVVQARPDARLLVLGTGEDAASLDDLAKRLGIDHAVQFCGFQANPFAYLSRASCFVSASRWEGFGMVIVEAMASGAPVVATDCEFGPREILRDGADGLLVEPERPEELGRALLAVAGSPELRAKLRDRGLVRARDFDVATVIPQYARLLDQVTRRVTTPRAE